jgi:hypothetical protein
VAQKSKEKKRFEIRSFVSAAHQWCRRCILASIIVLSLLHHDSKRGACGGQTTFILWEKRREKKNLAGIIVSCLLRILLQHNNYGVSAAPSIRGSVYPKGEAELQFEGGVQHNNNRIKAATLSKQHTTSLLRTQKANSIKRLLNPKIRYYIEILRKYRHWRRGRVQPFSSDHLGDSLSGVGNSTLYNFLVS